MLQSALEYLWVYLFIAYSIKFLVLQYKIKKCKLPQVESVLNPEYDAEFEEMISKGVINLEKIKVRER